MDSLTKESYEKGVTVSHLIKVDYEIITSLKVNLVRSDSTKTKLLSVGTNKTISFVKDGQLYTVTGLIEDIKIVYHNRASIGFEGTESVYIILDCSEKNKSSIVTILVDSIRDIISEEDNIEEETEPEVTVPEESTDTE